MMAFLNNLFVPVFLMLTDNAFFCFKLDPDGHAAVKQDAQIMHSRLEAKCYKFRCLLCRAFALIRGVEKQIAVFSQPLGASELDSVFFTYHCFSTPPGPHKDPGFVFSY
jgi:hypothetical protein